MPEHTPGKLERGDPEEYREFTLFIGDECIADCDNRPFRSAEETEPIVRRLVACWNACEGLATEILEGAGPPPSRQARLMNAAPDLLAACKAALEGIDGAYQSTGSIHVRVAKTSEVRTKIEAAIAKAERGG